MPDTPEKEVAYADGYREGRKAGYADGVVGGKGIGYSDAKTRSRLALDAAFDRLETPSRHRDVFILAHDNIVGRVN